MKTTPDPKTTLASKTALCLCLANFFFPSCSRSDPDFAGQMESAQKCWNAAGEIIDRNMDPAGNSAVFDSVLTMIDDARFSISGTRGPDWTLAFLDNMSKDDAIDSLVISGLQHFKYISSDQVDRGVARARALLMLKDIEQAVQIQYLKGADPLATDKRP